MKLLITGGCGFLGSNLAAHAISNGIDLCVFDNLMRSGSQLNLDWLRSVGRFQFIHGDIRNSDDVSRVVQVIKPQMVFHLAGQVAMTTSIANPRLDFEINVLGTLNLLEAVRQHAHNAGVIYSSTNKVYGDLEQFQYKEAPLRYVCSEYPLGFSENIPLNFSSPYGCSKGAADQYLLDYCSTYGLKTAVFRHSSMYGGRQFATEDQGWVGWFCKMAVETQNGSRVTPFNISGNGKQVRDVLHAADMVDLYFDAASHIDNIAGAAYNIGGGIVNSLSLLELFKLLEQLIGRSLIFRQGPVRLSDQRIFVADTRAIHSKLGWQPKVSAPDGIKTMLNWAEKLVVR